MDIKKRLNCVIQKDKQNNPKHLIDLIKSDFYYLINNYFEVDFKDVELKIIVVGDKYKIELDAMGDRIKMMRALPDEM